MEGKVDLVVEAYIIFENKILLVHHTKTDKWLPPGGHIDPNETFDEAVIREVKEETDLDIEFLHKETATKDDNIVTHLALPFYADVHTVGDHNHACLFYLCKPKHDHVKISPESKDFKWFTPEELEKATGVKPFK